MAGCCQTLTCRVTNLPGVQVPNPGARVPNFGPRYSVTIGLNQNCDHLTCMPAVYDIRDLQDGLLIRARRRRAWTRSLFVAFVTGLAALLTLSHFLTGSILVVVVLLAVLLGLSEGFGQSKADLRVTKLEFQTRGNLGTGSRPFSQSFRSVCSADIRWLEYQPKAVGPDVGYRPGGLYAKLRLRTVCLLPLLDEKQTIEVIDHIARRFPDMAKQWSAPSLGDHFTTLGIRQN